ncbi:HAD hydrolase-like protein [Streptomyces hoynatensis]|uniref:HAD hydrolase-like protein n=1 Tax=Streptomyces hoynatensis TaxID=1141874 RepID=UPI0019D4B6F5|nr:HAD hydrolase-like protein [Streptomyces hoynatensis]
MRATLRARRRPCRPAGASPEPVRADPPGRGAGKERGAEAGTARRSAAPRAVHALDDAIVSDFYAAAQKREGRMKEVGTCLPGAVQAISAIHEGPAAQSVVTGNIRSIAKVKLGAFDLAHLLDLEVGGYGDEGSDRADLVRLARRRAEDTYRTSFAEARIFVIGDTPHDVKGAHDAGAFAIGVATGGSSADVLQECGADLVLADLTNVDALRKAVFGLG